MSRAGLAATLACIAACGRSPLVADVGDAGATVDVVEVGGPRNACGGERPLAGRPGDACGRCGVTACAGPEELRCDDREAPNACGGCGPVPEEECNGRDDDCDGVVDEGCVRRVAALPTQETRARVSGDRVAFDVEDGSEDVALAAVSTGEVRVLTARSDPGRWNDPSPEGDCAVDGDLVAWARRDPATSAHALVLLDLRTGRERVISPDGVDATEPAVDAGRVAFRGQRPGGDPDVWLWDAAFGARPVTGPAAEERAPDLSGRWLVFERGPLRDATFHTDIVARDLATGEEAVLTAGLAGWSRAPAIDGDRVVWHREEGTQAPSYIGQVLLYDLAARARRELTPTRASFNPRIAGDLVCWSTTNELGPYGGAWSEGGVTVTDLATGRSRVLSRTGQLCDVAGRRVVWLDRRPTLDPYVRDLLPGEP